LLNCINQKLVMNMSVRWYDEYYNLKCGTHLITILKHWGTTYKKTYYMSGTNMRLLMVFKKIITVCSQNHMNIKGRIYGQNAELLNAKARGVLVATVV
jgi:hypothetical protein